MTTTRIVRTPRVKQSYIVNRLGLYPARVVVAHSGHFMDRYVCYLETFINRACGDPVDPHDNLSYEQAMDDFDKRYWAIAM